MLKRVYVCLCGLCRQAVVAGRRDDRVEPWHWDRVLLAPSQLVRHQSRTYPVWLGDLVDSAS